MRSRLAIFADPFLALLLGVVAAASLLPARGQAAAWVQHLSTAAIVLLFFLHGAKLSRAAIVAGMTNWRLHALVLFTSFAIFPLLGVGMASLSSGLMLPAAAAGLLFLTLLPSTVQSSIAYTSIAGGNVAAAVCSASFSSLLGTVLTPALVALLMSVDRGAAGAGGSTLAAVEQIAAQLLLPFLLGHFSRPLTAGFVLRHKGLVSKVDRTAILLVVYAAFGAAVNEGLWHRVSGATLAAILVASCLLLAAALAITWGLGRAFRLPREDAIVLLFCGSKKSLASGVPMAAVLFPPAEVGMLILPLMMFHQIQLMVCAVIARHLARKGAAA